MWKQKLQKITSFFLIFSLMFSFTIQLPLELFFGSRAFALEKEFVNLVSIVVDEDTYDATRSKLVRYSRDIQGVLENTRVVILPTPSDASVIDIASLGESLYLEGYKSLSDVDYESRLIGTVFVGKIPMPTVFDGSDSSRTMLPYIDFVDKSYIYNHDSQRYEKNTDADTRLSPEIWHGVISPNTGDEDDDIQAIEDFFDKNHDFYTGQGVFDQEKGILDGLFTSVEEDYEPYVFYYDQFREHEALQYQNYVGYESYLENIEDITYNRYSKELAERVSQRILGVQNADIVDLLREVDPDFDISGVQNAPDPNSSSDILTRYITDNSTKKLLEVFNGSTLGEMRKQVYNAGRYNENASTVNMDMPPFLISVLDQVSSEVIRNVNTALESQITDLVANGLSRNIEIPVRREVSCGASYENFYYGLGARGVTNASECSIYRGSPENGGQLVEANRGRNINLVEDDVALCSVNIRINESTGQIRQGVQTIWGGNTPVNLAGEQAATNFGFNLGEHNPQESYIPVYDIVGSDIADVGIPAPSPIDCFESGTFMQVSSREMREHTYTVSRSDGESEERTHNYCSTKYIITVPENGVINPRQHIDYYRGLGHDNNHEYVPLESKRESWTRFCVEDDIDAYSISGNLSDATQTKFISSYILHTAPTDQDFGAQIQSNFTPALPIDSDRYIDFIGARGGSAPDYGYQRIDFPQFFRVDAPSADMLTLEGIEQLTKEYLDNISNQINTVIEDARPTEDIPDQARTGEFPQANIDLYTELKERPLEIFTLQNESKEISYFDTLVFSIYWNNLDSVSSKYKFIFQEYLSNQFTGNNYNFHLPKSKKSYEIGYFAAPGDAQNMYVKLDPELKGIHPYADIISQYLSLNTTISGANVGEGGQNEGVFECAPPDGVNIFEWIPAVICWLTDMLPPTVEITEGSCGAPLLTSQEQAEIDACNKDDNKNGINDCLEQKLIGGELELVSDAGRYYYFTTGTIVSRTITNQGELAKFDSSSYISHALSQLAIPANPDLPFDSSNQRVIYDISIPELSTPEAYQEAQKYISYRDVEIRSMGGETKTYFYGKGQDADITFNAQLETRDIDGNITISLQSNDLNVSIRGDRLFIGGYRVEEDARYTIDSSIVASNQQNICAADANAVSVGDAVLQADTLSQAKEKLLLMFENYSRAGNSLSLNYPLTIELLQSGQRVFYQENVSAENLSSVYGLLNISSSGRYEIHVRDSEDFHSYRVFDVLPDVAMQTDIVLGTNIIETGGNVSTHLVNIFDQFGNAASGNIYSLSATLQGDGLVFADTNQAQSEYTIIEGYKALRLKSTTIEDNNVLDIELKNISGDIIDTRSVNIRTIDEIIPQMTLAGAPPRVGGDSYTYDIVFTDSDNNVLTDLNSRVYLTVPRMYGQVDTPYTLVQNGRAQVSFTTSTLAGQDITLELQLEGGADIFRENITILPDVPIKVDLNLSRAKIEASPEDRSILQATLKDRYNNDVFTDMSTAINLEIHPRSAAIITASSLREISSRGKAQFEISGTDIPGTGYFSVSTDPDLAQNSFELIGQAPFDKSELIIPSFVNASGDLTETGNKFFRVFSDTKFISRYYSKDILEASQEYRALAAPLREQVSEFWDETNSLTLNGLGRNAGSIETFFFWDKQDIEGNAYNTLYTMMLGAQYGDFSQQDYLAGSLLFDRDNAALAVTSLLNTPYKYFDVLRFEDTGTLEGLYSADVSQDIQLRANIDDAGRVIVDIHNEALESYIGRAYYNISGENDIVVTPVDESYDIFETNAGVEIRNQNDQIIFTVDSNARFARYGSTYIEIDRDNNAPGLQLRVMRGQSSIAEITISGDFDINVTRDAALLQAKLAALDETIIFHIQSNQYSTRSSQIGENTTLSLYYQDPFGTPNALDNFHNNDISGIESTLKEEGIGWQDSNTVLLNFAAGESVGESSKNFHSFSLVHLGDPVISLKPIVTTFKNSSTQKHFDSTVGRIIESDAGLIGYNTLDYNNDSREDVITIHRDGYVSLYENQRVRGDYIYQRDLVFAADGGPVRLVESGDFTGDGHDDIFFVTQLGQPAIFNNVQKDFSRFDVSQSITLSGAIIQAETFDMDSDGRDDIVTLDDTGQIHIFYGSGTSENPVFDKKFIGDGYAIELSELSTSHGGGIYFDGLVQLSDERASQILTNSQQYLQELENAQNGDGAEPVPEFIDESLVESFLYIALPYTPTGFLESRTKAEIITDSLTTELGSDQSAADNTQASVTEFLNSYDNYISYDGFESAQETETYFLRGQYASQQGIEISKTFTDTTPEFLQSGDTVYYDISITNTTSSRINNVAYVDTIPKFFQFSSSSFKVFTEDNLEIQRSPGINNYSILLDGFYLDPGEELIVRYELKTLPLSYGFLQVGLYEQGELGDDIYGDIILKEDEKNCGNQADIYRSTDVREYEGGTTVPECRASDIELGTQFGNLEDTDGDGVPDYIQELLSSSENAGSVSDSNDISPSDLEMIQDYSDDIMTQLGVDSDGDGIPDSDDSMDNTDSATDFMGALDNINQAIDEISEDIDELIQGLSCGFGGGSCIASPLNWAPLAPGNDPTLFGYPVGDGLRVSEGVPVFSALTGRQTSCGTSPCCLPSVFPATSATFVPGPFCGGPGAGGSLGTNAATNFVRVFATPTLTGGFGIAVCFGGPASVAGNGNPRGVHPIVPGGNCIVAAMPLMSCEGGEGDPGVLGYPYVGNGFGLIQANCDGDTQDDVRTPLQIESEFVRDYLEYLQTGVQPTGLYERYVDSFSSISENGAGNYTLPSEPLINIGGGGTTAMGGSVEIDPSAIFTGNGDVIDVQNTRVAAFPGFLMDWVERQLDEITSKLTNLPKIFVILPDFGGIFDFSFENFGEGVGEAFNKGKENSLGDREAFQTQIDTLRAQKENLDCSGNDALTCRSIDLKIIGAQGQQYGSSGKETLSGIREVYEFMGNIPLLNVESEVIPVNIPWIEGAELDRFILDWSATAEQWKQEVESKSRSWSSGATCEGTPAQIARCEQENDIKDNLVLDAQQLIQSLERNIQILEEYKEFPDKVAKLINIKEVWLEQILCNVEAISKLMGEWINTNGERFKAWVELYLLIKAILKSWQLFIDVFAGYEAECHECKNERQDLQSFIFRLISVAIPSAPIIEFPKWPDIILDLHNVRAGLTVYMPDFEVNKRPIVLPTLPKLQLPDVPSASFSLPELPTLPMFELPDLPELKSLPTVELPNLPPPPKIPQLFGSVEGMLNIIKLITKAMCFLKQSPFVPEWRAGDQIAFLTERNGYLPTDFIDVQPATFSYSTISAIKVTTYVNLEFEMEFLLEAVRAITAPIDDMTNNIVNMWNPTMTDISQIASQTFDVRGSDQNFVNQLFDGIDTTQFDDNFNYEIPTDEFLESIGIDVNSVPETIQLDIPVKDFFDEFGLPIFSDTTVDLSSFTPLDENPESILTLVGLFSAQFVKLISYMGGNAHETMSNRDFISYVNSGLASTSFTENARTQEIRNVWNQVTSMNYTKEQDFIEELREKNKSKFDTFEAILKTEIEYSQQQQDDLENNNAPEKFIQTLGESGTRFDQYNDQLMPYNIDTLDAAIALASGQSESDKKFEQEIKLEGENLMKRVRGGLDAYKNGNLLSAVSGNTPASDSAGGVCQGNGASDYIYEGIYVLQEDKNYRLFDYVDHLRGDEEITLVDSDNDGDEDVLYLTNGKLYFKENRQNTPSKNYISLPPLIVSADDNEFYNGDIYYESVNGFKEASVSDGYMNVIFKNPTNPTLKNFRLQYNTIVDRYLDEGDSYTPETVQTHLVDALADIDEIPVLSEDEDYRITEHLATLSYAGAIRGATLTTEKLVNLRDDLEAGRLVTLTSNTHIYSDNNAFSLTYRVGNSEEKTLNIARNKTLSFTRPVEVLALNGNAYVSSGILEDIENTDIIDYIGKPLMIGSSIKFDGNKDLLGANDHIDIRYYDGSELFIDMRDIVSYELYDLGASTRADYTIRQEVENNFYYARIHSFSENINSTKSHQILLSPQTQADRMPPQIGLNQKIRIPVYQSQEVDLTPYIYEDSGLAGISDVWVDFDLLTDSDEDGNTRNDRDTDNISIAQSLTKIAIEFGPFDTLFERDIVIALTDDNGNTATKQVSFEVYAPVPSIIDIDESVITGVIDEDLLDEPVRLYRYRGGVIEKLQSADGDDVVATDDIGNYSFETSSNAEGLELTYSGSVIANIDEYTGRVDLLDPLVTTRVYASNHPDNSSVYPEIVITRLGQAVFKQFLKLPEGQVREVSSLDNLDDIGIYMKLINSEEYGSFSVPLGVAYNPGSLSVFPQNDANKIPIMTIFSDGRIEIDRANYRLRYESLGEYAGLKLQRLSGNSDVADILFKTNASYILR